MNEEIPFPRSPLPLPSAGYGDQQDLAPQVDWGEVKSSCDGSHGTSHQEWPHWAGPYRLLCPALMTPVTPPPPRLSWAAGLKPHDGGPGSFEWQSRPPQITWDSVMEDLRELRRNPPKPPPQAFILSEGDQRSLGLDPAPFSALVFTPADWVGISKKLMFTEKSPFRPVLAYDWVDEAQHFALTGQLLTTPPQPIHLRPKITFGYLFRTVLSWLRR